MGLYIYILHNHKRNQRTGAGVQGLPCKLHCNVNQIFEFHVQSFM